jgi:hypothetical protein
MAIAAYVNSLGLAVFPVDRTRNLVAILFPNVRDKLAINMLIIGVREYYERLRESR